MERIEITNLETGEIISNWVAEIKGLNYVNDNLRTVMNVGGIKFDSSNIGIYLEAEDDEIEDFHPIFGEYVELRDKRKFSKVFQLSDPEFSRGTYYQYWFRLILHLSKNTNVIFSRNPIKVCDSKDELTKLVDGSRATFYRFYSEASSKRCIAEFVLNNERFFIINPLFGLNGYRMPKILVALFTDPLVYEKKREGA